MCGGGLVSFELPVDSNPQCAGTIPVVGVDSPPQIGRYLQNQLGNIFHVLNHECQHTHTAVRKKSDYRLKSSIMRFKINMVNKSCN